MPWHGMSSEANPKKREEAMDEVKTKLSETLVGLEKAQKAALKVHDSAQAYSARHDIAL